MHPAPRRPNDRCPSYAEYKSPSETFHLLNPKAESWQQLLRRRSDMGATYRYLSAIPYKQYENAVKTLVSGSPVFINLFDGSSIMMNFTLHR